MRERKRFEFHKPSLTKQSPAAECSIANIIEKFRATGLMPNRGEAKFGNAEENDFQSSQFAIADAKSRFESLPSAEKARLGTPAALVREQIKHLESLYGTQSDTKSEADTEPKAKTLKDTQDPNTKSEAEASRSNADPEDSREAESS